MKPILKSTRDLLILVIVATGFSLGLYSCKKETDSTPVTEDEAAEVMVQAIDPASGGLMLQTSSSITISLSNTNPSYCGIKRDTTITKQGGSGVRTYSYNLNWSRLLTCNGAVPSKFDYTFTGSSTYNAPKMSSSDSSEGAFTITGLEISSPELNINQSYTRNGSQQSKVRNNRTFNSKTVIKTNVKINKVTQIITSGTGTISIDGTASTGESFSYTGTLTFLGGNKVTLAVTGGNTYTIQW